MMSIFFCCWWLCWSLLLMWLIVVTTNVHQVVWIVTVTTSILYQEYNNYNCTCIFARQDVNQSPITITIFQTQCDCQPTPHTIPFTLIVALFRRIQSDKSNPKSALVVVFCVRDFNAKTWRKFRKQPTCRLRQFDEVT